MAAVTFSSTTNCTAGVRSSWRTAIRIASEKSNVPSRRSTIRAYAIAMSWNSASTIFTMDLYKRHLRPETSPRGLVRVGRIATGVFVLLACLVAPHIGGVKGIFDYIQKFQGFISPGIVAVFLFGLVSRRAPPVAALVGMGLNVVVYGLLLLALPDMAFLNHMAITFVVILVVMAVLTALRPLSEPVTLPVNEDIDTTPAPAARLWGLCIVLATIALYIVFW